VGTLGAIVLAGSAIGDGWAKTPKVRFSATVNGKRMKALKRATFLTLASTSFSVIGQSKPRKGVSRAITALCGPGVDLRSLALPATLACYGSYVEARRKGSKEWVRPNGIEVTVESFDGSRAEGTFRGTLDTTVAHAGDPPVAIEEGRFSVIARDTGF
jgi:hypothetical protein